MPLSHSGTSLMDFHLGDLTRAPHRLRFKPDLQTLNPEPSPVTKPDLFSVPRRFDLFTVLVAAAGFAVLFTGMRLLDFPPAMMGVTGGLFIAVAIGQALTPAKYGPRLGSLAAAVAYWCVVIAYIIVSEQRRRGITSAGRLFVETILSIPLGAIYGLLSGYVVGVLVASVFLVSYHLRERFSLPAANAETARHELSPWDETEDPPKPNIIPAPHTQNPTDPLAGKPP